MTRLFSKFHLPDVTAYLVSGVLIGPCVLGRLGIPGLGFNSFEQVDSRPYFPMLLLALLLLPLVMNSVFPLCGKPENRQL